ncbi:hypothetical protein CsSME_00008157 [Camellia sinensis var. sinensis]
MKAAKGKGAPIRVPKEALKPVDDGFKVESNEFYMHLKIKGNSKRRAILLGVGALALSSCPASSLFAEGMMDIIYKQDIHSTMKKKKLFPIWLDMSTQHRLKW